MTIQLHRKIHTGKMHSPYQTYLPPKRIDRTLLLPVLQGKLKIVYRFLSIGWCIAFLWFWRWWAQSDHIISLPGFIISTIVLLWITGQPILFFFFTNRMQRTNPAIPLPTDWRVAMIVTKAPSEPWDVVRKTLEAMLTQQHPHDTWLADEAPTVEALAWCHKHGVRVSSRQGSFTYHQAEWPKRTRCKEGNLAYFYDKYGYESYDFVVQLDADHCPREGYLEAMLRPFVDKAIGYVSAPSICGANRDRSWAVRGRLFAEATMHGPIQAGYSNRFAPLCIGSHYAVRTSALKEIGGLGPELAEDHSTTLMMNAHGWRGIHALDGIADGDGPPSFADAMVQEFQWSRSLVVILLTMMPHYWRYLPGRIKFQFLFSQLWFPLTGLAMAIGFLIPFIALFSKEPLMSVSYVEFLWRVNVMNLFMFGAVILLKRQKLLRPFDGKILSWEVALFQITRWPWVLYGSLSGVYSVITKKNINFKVTPKGDGVRHFPFATLIPYIVLATCSALVALVIQDAGNAKGYYYFAILSSLLYAMSAIVLMRQHRRENKPKNRKARLWWKQSLLSYAALILPIASCVQMPSALEAILGVETMNEVQMMFDPDATIVDLTHPSVNFGIYDYNRQFDTNGSFAIDHQFINWSTVTEDELSAEIAQMNERNRWILFSVEPFPKSENVEATLLNDVVAGAYDAEIDQICRTLSTSETPVFFRWGHEMEGTTGRYPWAGANTETYISAYQHVVTRCQLSIQRDQIYFVWSPLGQLGAKAYYPGSDYVDYVGLPVFSFSEWEYETYNGRQSFEQILWPRYNLVADFGKPIMIAEMGVTGASGYQAKWLNDAVQSVDNYPLLRTAVLFNAVDTAGVWGEELSTPDWNIGQLEFVREKLD